MKTQEPPPYLFRPQRRSLADAMAEVREVPTMAALRAAVRRRIVSIEPYPRDSAIDERIGWRTYIVMEEHPNPRYPQGSVAGFTNGIPPE